MDVLQNVSVTVDELLRKSARRWPRRAALIDDTGVVDYQTLLQQVERAKEALKAAGVKPGHCIALMGRDGRAFVVSAFAAVGCGAVVMPTAPRLTHWELSRMLDSASVHAILDDGTGVLPASWRFHRIPIGSDLQVRLGWREHQPVGSVKDLVPDAAFIRFTSGTTGASKGVVLSHKDVIERTAAANRGLGLGSRDTVLWVLPMAYHFFVSIVLYLRYGVTVVVCREHLARALLETANRHQATFLYASPLQYRWLVADESDTRFSHLCHAVSTSTRLDPRTAELFSQRYGLPVAQAYGIIEVGLPMVNLDGAATRPGSVGRAQPDFEVALFGEGGMGKLVCPCMGPAQLKPVPDGKVGQLAVRGPGMFSAYLNPPKLREEVLVDGWFLTADLAHRSRDGYVTIVGRCMSVIDVAGEKVFPEEVQGVIDQHPQVSSSRVIGRPHPYFGEIVQAEIVPVDPCEPVCTEELIAFCRKRLSSFKVPQSVSIVERIEQTASDKKCHSQTGLS